MAPMGLLSEQGKRTSGGGGIRTLDGRENAHNGFRDRRIQPLCHPSRWRLRRLAEALPSASGRPGRLTSAREGRKLCDRDTQAMSAPTHTISPARAPLPLSRASLACVAAAYGVVAFAVFAFAIRPADLGRFETLGVLVATLPPCGLPLLVLERPPRVLPSRRRERRLLRPTLGVWAGARAGAGRGDAGRRADGAGDRRGAAANNPAAGGPRRRVHRLRSRVAGATDSGRLFARRRGPGAGGRVAGQARTPGPVIA